jgi:hypothetical protein
LTKRCPPLKLHLVTCSTQDGSSSDPTRLFVSDYYYLNRQDGEHRPRTAKRGELGSRIGYCKRHGFVNGLAGVCGTRRVGGYSGIRSIGRINGIVDTLDGEPCASSWGMCSIHGD